MHLSSRQHMLLASLMQSSSFLTAEQLAAELGASTRTVHRELKEIETIVNRCGLELEKKTGAGIRLAGTEEARLKLHEMMHQDAKKLDYTQKERTIILLCRLLQEEEPVKLLLLADEARVTVVKVAGDLDYVERWAEPMGLQLIRRRGYGIELAGSESVKRQAIYVLIAENIDESQRLGLIRGDRKWRGLASSLVTKKLLELIAVEEMPRIDGLIRQLPIFKAQPLADVSYADLILRMAILVKRRRQAIHLEEPSSGMLRAVSDQERETARQIAEAMNTLLNEPLKPVELERISLFVRGAQPGRVHQEMELARLEQAEIHAIMQQLVMRCESRLGVPFSSDKVLLNGLMAHLEPAVQRLRQQQPVYNPHLKRIIADYSELFGVIAEAMQDVMPNTSIPNDEIGFLVMHFAAAIERTFRTNRRIRAVVFCSSGIGTSKMLSSRLQREIPEIDIVGNVSVFDVHLLDKSKYDLIISTVILPIEPDKYIRVSPLLSEEELFRVKERIVHLTMPSWQEIQEEQTPADELVSGNHEELQLPADAAQPIKEQIQTALRLELQTDADQTDKMSALMRMKSYVDLSVSIVNRFRQQEVSPADTLEEVLQEICGMLEQEGLVRDADHIAHKLIERQQTGGLGIPMTSLALLHTRSDDVCEPIFRLYRLAIPLQLESMDYSLMTIKDVLLLLSPQQAKPEALEVLSEISAFFIDNHTVEQFATHDEERMRSHLEERLYAFCYDKMTWKGNDQ